MNLQQHPLSAAFPAMSADDFKSLKESIDNIGVQNPVTIFEGMVIDGWHRYQAANDLGMECPTVELADVDPRDFVLAQNKTRRHITQAQLAMATTAVYAWAPVGNPALSQSDTECPIGKTNDELAQIAGVHKNSIKQAKAVQTKATPEVQAAVKRGDIGLPKAAAIAKLPAEQQAAAMDKPLPKPVTAPAAAQTTSQGNDELNEAALAISELAAENERLNDRLAVEAMDATEEEKTAAAELIADLRQQVKTLSAELDAVRISRNTFQAENSELMKQVQRNQRELKKLMAAA